MKNNSVFSLAFLYIALGCFGVSAEPVRFVVVGDLPYSEDQARVLESEIRPAIAAGNFPFAIHLGDFKAGGADCTETGLITAHDRIMTLIPGRVFYTPGDNDWTDCDRDKLSNPISEMKRLTRLREVFYAELVPVPDAWRYRRQFGYPENATWRHDGIQFATLHVVGTNNGRREIELDDKPKALDAVDARDAANLKWLQAAFAAASKPDVKVLVIAMQADISRVNWTRDCSRKYRSKCDGFGALRDNLMSQSAALRKPVLLVHGDTGRLCIDRAFGGERAANLWRLNSAGDWVVDAVVVEVDAASAKKPFGFRRLLKGAVLQAAC